VHRWYAAFDPSIECLLCNAMPGTTPRVSCTGSGPQDHGSRTDSHGAHARYAASLTIHNYRASMHRHDPKNGAIPRSFTPRNHVQFGQFRRERRRPHWPAAYCM